MRCIAELNFNSVDPMETKGFKTRETARGVVTNPEGKIALLKAREGYYKLPGGKIEGTESMVEAFRRECLEEAGVTLTNVVELGFVREIRKETNVVQTSYAYKAQANGDPRPPQFTESEKEKGFKLVWLTLDTAITELKRFGHISPNGKYVAARELAILKAYQAYGNP